MDTPWYHEEQRRTMQLSTFSVSIKAFTFHEKIGPRSEVIFICKIEVAKALLTTGDLQLNKGKVYPESIELGKK